MALTFEFLRPPQMTRTGVALWLMPALVSGFRSADPVEVARAPDSGGSPGTWVTIARLDPLPSQGRAFVDTRPWTTSLWWYRYRHVRADGAVASAWSAEVQQSVRMLPQNVENVSEQQLAMVYRATPFGEDGQYALQAIDAVGRVAQDTAAKLITDFTNALITVTDAQGTPTIRTKFGKVGAGAQDYGVQVFDKDAATVMDFTGAKRILAVPVQASVDSGASLSIDLSTGLTQQIRLTGTATITLTNPTNGARYRLWLQQDATGSRPFPTLLGPNGEVFMYTNGTPPTLTTTPGAMDLFELEYRTSPTTRFTVATLQTNVLLPTPQVQGTPTATSVSTASTTHNILMPATVDADDLLLMFITFDVTQGAVTTPTGWTSKGTTGLTSVFTKLADGTEDGTTVNVVTANSVKAAAHVYRITSWFKHAGTGVDVSLGSGAPGTSSDPGTVSPGAPNDRFLWLAGTSVTGNPAITDPANYGTPIETGDGSSTCKIRTLRRVLYAASENPGAFTWSGSQSWTSITVAVRPPA